MTLEPREIWVPAAMAITHRPSFVRLLEMAGDGNLTLVMLESVFPEVAGARSPRMLSKRATDFLVGVLGDVLEAGLVLARVTTGPETEIKFGGCDVEDGV